MRPVRLRDQRWSARRPMTFALRLECAGRPAQTAVAHNLSIGGLFVETGGEPPDPNERVTVALELRLNGEGLYCRLPARVIWRTPHSAGLMFTDFRAENVRALRRLLEASDK